MTVEEGETYTHERTFTHEDVQRFADVTGDTQEIHTEPDADGRLVVHGLLTGSLLTKIGGDLTVFARQMDFRFRRPVYTGDTIRCSWTNERVEQRADGVDVVAEVVCHRIEGDEPADVVLEATVEGIISK
jgi:acyl dehydratase